MTNAAQANKHDSDTLDMHTPNLVDDNVQKIMALFPNCITESEDENGKLKKAVDFDLLRQELSQSLVEGGQERYRLDWPGKRQAILEANSPIAKTLRPARDESVNFDTTENLFIEGDNLDALKLLQESYLGQVKIIYIDPPYNTGNDFIYEDDFSENTEDFLERSEQKDEEGNRLVSNTETNGRFHSDWLTMMYSRLKLARNLLKDDGVIFISCDDNEVHNLRKICDEIFGQINFVSQVPRIAKRTSNKGTYFKPTKDYVLVYGKILSSLPEFGIRKEREETDYNLVEDDGRKYKKSGASLYQPSLDSRPNQRYYIEAPDGSLIIPPGNIFPKEKKDGSKVKPINNSDKVWRWSLATYLKQKHLLIFTEGTSRNPLLDENGNQSKWNIYPKVYFDDDVDGLLHPEDVIYDFPNSQGTKEIKSLSIPFSFAKPVGLITFLASLINSKDCIVLDFFAGSASTAHAVIDLNAKDKGNRKFVMVQLDEDTEEGSEAYNTGFTNIAEISKERIRRAGKKIVEDNRDKDGIDKLDIGFRVLKIDETNMKKVYYTPDEYLQAELDNLESHIKEDRTGEDLLFQVMLDWGVPLSLPIEVKQIQDSTVYYVGIDSLVACFDTLTTDLIDEISRDKPLKFVSSELAIAHDQDKTNIKARFAQLSPDTQVKFI